MKFLTEQDFDIILKSLECSHLKIENYPIGEGGYPSYEYKRQRLDEIEAVIGKIALLKKG